MDQEPRHQGGEGRRAQEIAEILNRLQEVQWDRCTLHQDITVYGWIERGDRRADFVVLEFWSAEGGGLGYRLVATSSAELSESIVRRLCGEESEHFPCRRVEDVFGALVPNAIELTAKVDRG